MEIKQHRIGSISFVDLAAVEPEEQGRFYGEMLGWERLDLAGGRYTMFTVGDVPVAGMLPIPTSGDLSTQWSIYVTVADADGTCAEAESLGGAVLQAPSDLAGSGRVAMIADPGGAAICVFEGPVDGGFKSFDEPGAPCWFEEMTTDGVAALGFYERLFGWVGTKMEGLALDYWTCSLMPDAEADDDALSITSPDGDLDGRFAGIMQYPDGMDGGLPSWQVSFSIHTDIDTFIERALGFGAELAAGPTNTAFGSGAIMLDPAGARFGAFDRSRLEA